MERAAARLDDDRNRVELRALGRSCPRPCEPVVGRVELRPRRRRLRPRVRAADELDRPGVCLRLVERDPARDHLRRDEVVGVRGVLVEPDRLRPRRLPEDVVLENAHAAVARELRGESAGSLGQHLSRDDVVRLPRVAELARAVLRIAAGHPVHLVRPDPGLVLAVEQRDVALAEESRPRSETSPSSTIRKPSLPNASTCSAVNDSIKRVAATDRYERGRVLSGS